MNEKRFCEDRSRDTLIRARNELSIATNILLGKSESTVEEL